MMGIICRNCGKRNSFFVMTKGGLRRRKYCGYCGRQLFPVRRITHGDSYDVRYVPANDSYNHEVIFSNKEFDEILKEVCKNEHS